MNPRIRVPLFAVSAFSLAMAITGVLLAPRDVWPNVLLSGMLVNGIGLAAAFLLAVHDSSGGRWLGPVRPIASSLTTLVVPGTIIALAAIMIGGSTLYPAFTEHFEGFKGVWLDRTFFTARACVYALLWITSTRLLRKGRGTAFFLVMFAVTVSFASFDWIMALEPHWASTVFGVYHFAGMVTAGLATVVIVTIRRSRKDTTITSDHLHDLGKMLFAFSTFWMYIWFSQAMLIWYSNLPEETGHYSRRAYGNWGVLFWAVVVMMWGLPFFVLLSEKTKRNRTILFRIAVTGLIGHWLDLYVSIVAAQRAEPQVTGWDLALAVGAFAIVGWAATRRSEEQAAEVEPGEAAIPPRPATALTS